MSIGSRLLEERRSARLTQSEVSKICEMAFSTYHTYEKGARTPDAAYLAKLYLAGVDVLYIVTGTRNNSTLSNTQAAVLEQFGQIDERLQPAVLTSLQALAATKL